MPVATPSSSISATRRVGAERAFVAPEVAGDVRVLLGAEELRRRLVGDEVHPEVDDVHLSSALGAARRGQGN